MLSVENVLQMKDKKEMIRNEDLPATVFLDSNIRYTKTYIIYSRTSVARTLMARLLWLFRTRT